MGIVGFTRNMLILSSLKKYILNLYSNEETNFG